MTELAVYRTAVETGWIDYNGHLRDAFYGVLVSLAIDQMMDEIGLDAAYRERTHGTLYTLETHLHYLLEIKGTDLVTVTTSILDCDRKRIHAGCRLTTPRLDRPAATADVMLLHVQQGDAVKSAPFPDDVLARLEALKLSPDAAAAFGPASRKIELKRR